MAWFVLNSRITITSAKIGEYTYQFSGIHSVRIRKSIHSIIETASLEIPSIAEFIPAAGGLPIKVTTGNMFEAGDLITIELGYNSQYKEEFAGFIKRMDFDMPLKIECEGYARQLRLNSNTSANFKQTTASALLELACKNTDISVKCPVDFPLYGIRLSNASGVQICDFIKRASSDALTVFFINPTTLWCGLTYTAYASGGGAKPLQLINDKTVKGESFFGFPGVGYRIGYNTPKKNDLKVRTDSEPVQVIINSKNPNGTISKGTSKNSYATQKKSETNNFIGDNNTANLFAQEKEYFLNYTGFEGKLTAFLQPYCLPGYNAYIIDKRYPNLIGTYIIESTEVVFGMNGARRLVEVGPQVGFTNTTPII